MLLLLPVMLLLCEHVLVKVAFPLLASRVPDSLQETIPLLVPYLDRLHQGSRLGKGQLAVIIVLYDFGSTLDVTITSQVVVTVE